MTIDAGLTSGAVGFELSDSILTITLSRPERRNAMTREMGTDLVRLLDYSDATDEVKAVIVTGTGKSFCAGADLTGRSSLAAPAASPAETAQRRDFGGVIALRIFASDKPVIAAVNGDAAGVGASILLPMDLRIASTSARFGFVQVRRGIVPEGCSTWFLPRLVGISQAVEWTCSGRIFSAAEAQAAGLVKLADAEQLIATARQAAQEFINGLPPVSVAATRRMLWQALTFTHPMESHRMETDLVRRIGSLPDGREGIASFLECREPIFSASVSAEMGRLGQWWPARDWMPESSSEDGAQS
jgi:enoyl-CoA hydratase/carnithine racemase